MPPKVEFVVYTGDTTIAKKDSAHRKAIRSFVTAQHYREKRRIATREHEVLLNISILAYHVRWSVLEWFISTRSPASSPSSSP